MFESLFYRTPEPRTVFGVERRLDIPSDVMFDEERIQKVEAYFGSNCEHGWFDSCVDGAKLHYRKWMPKGKPKAILIYAHGIHTHSGNSYYRAERLNNHGYAFYCHDYYGHGYSEGSRFLIPSSWKNNLADSRSFVKLVASQHDPSIPIFLMGESYGANLTINLARHFQDNPESGPANLDSVILASSAISFDLPPYPIKLALRYILAPLFPRWVPFFMPKVTSDVDEAEKEEFVVLSEQLQLDKGAVPWSLGTATELTRAVEATYGEAIPGFAVPYCLIHGADDPVCPIDGPEYMWKTAATNETDKEFHPLKGVAHNVFESPEETASQITIEWIQKRLELHAKSK